MKVFIGSDPKAPIALNVTAYSVGRRASKPVSITPLILDQLPIARRGLTEFTYSRFLVPWLCHFEGWALFIDSDIVCLADVYELLNYANPKAAVMAVDTNPVFERAAVMLFNCAHPDNAILTPEYIERAPHLHALGWTQNAMALPNEWNWLAGYDPEPAVVDNGDERWLPAMAHFTKGLPIWPETANCPMADIWHAERRAMCGAPASWDAMMGKSVHVPQAEWAAE